jgi:hypothetical protein
VGTNRASDQSVVFFLVFFNSSILTSFSGQLAIYNSCAAR